METIMKKVEYLAVAEKALKLIKGGAFLTVTAGKDLNTMTIGWASIGFVWNKPVFMIAVRNSRFTFDLMEKAIDFTVSVPSGDMHETIMYCGTKSGRQVNKFEACQLKIADAQKTQSPIIDIPGLHFECTIILKSPMNPDLLLPSFLKLYPEKDFHTLYFGEILEAYELP
jgi:flavin reductase (DIM6/NTAB) family NADH-FMN oxidoreductase RutF